MNSRSAPSQSQSKRYFRYATSACPSTSASSSSSARAAAALARRSASGLAIRPRPIPTLREEQLSQAGVCGRVARVFRDRLLEMGDRFGARLRGPFVHEEPPLEIRLIRLDFPRGWPGQTLLLIARQLEPQLVGHLIGDFLLQLEYARHPAMELAAPDLRPVVHVDQLRPYRERVAALEHPAGQDCPDVQGAPDFLRLLRPPLVAEDGAPRHHAQLRKLRQRVDDRVGDPVAQVLHLRVLTRVRERQHGERVNRPPGAPFPRWRGLGPRPDARPGHGPTPAALDPS